MHEFRIKPLIDALDVLVNVSAMIASRHPKIFPNVGENARRDIEAYVAALIPELEKAELSLCRKAAERLIKTLRNTDDHQQIVSHVNDLRGRLLDQAELTFCLLLSPKEAALYEPNGAPFGPQVLDRFPSASEDIFEASKCLALGRATACVMHLMRVVEVGLKCLAVTVGVASQSDWGSYLREIDKALEARIKAAGKRSVDEQFYAEVRAMIDNVRLAWRNTTMHIETSYSTERAEEILISVRSLMRHLATRLSEKPS